MARGGASRFDVAAADHARRRASETSFRLQVAAVREFLPTRSERILDLGCGSGALAGCLGPVRADLVGADLSPGMLIEARGRGLAVARSDAGRLPFASGTFDAVLALGLLEYVSDVGAVLRETARALRPGGTTVLTWPNPWAPARLWMRLFPGRFDQDLARRLSVRLVAAAAEAAGLTVVRIRTAHAALLPWPLDALLPRVARALARACAPLTAHGPLTGIGTQMILVAYRPTSSRAQAGA